MAQPDFFVGTLDQWDGCVELLRTRGFDADVTMRTDSRIDCRVASEGGPSVSLWGSTCETHRRFGLELLPGKRGLPWKWPAHAKHVRGVVDVLKAAGVRRVEKVAFFGNGNDRCCDQDAE